MAVTETTTQSWTSRMGDAAKGVIVGLVLCSALFGFGGGIAASVIMLFYTLFFFSTDHSFIHFTAENLQKVGVTLVDVTADMLLVCFLKRAEVQAFQ